MRPKAVKKKEREKKPPVEQAHETLQADHEQFLQAFEKPTQIYRYLRTRNVVLPIFLTRNLWYMKNNRSVSNAKRKTFKADCLLDRVIERNNNAGGQPVYKSEYLNIAVKGFFDQEIPTNAEKAEVEFILLKVCHKKRKDVSLPVMQTCLGQVKALLNPIDTSLSGASVVISNDKFNQNNGHSVRSFVLVVRVTCPIKRGLPNGLYNGDITDEDEPPTKRRKNGHNGHSEQDAIVYCAELVIYDKNKRCLLTDGEYELLLREQGLKSMQKKNATWETVIDGKTMGPYEVFSNRPTLKFHLTWTATAQENGNHCYISTAQDEFVSNNQLASHILDTQISGTTKTSPIIKTASQTTPKKRIRIFYQFLYNNNTQQQTEARDDLRCPWCSVNCMQLYGLLKHLRLCHARFDFMYVPHSKGARIDVSINERYDGSYVGNPQDLHSHIGYAYSRNVPVRRTPVTHVIVYRPKRPEISLQEFIEAENDSHVNRQFVQGHNRLYFYQIINQPIRPHEIEFDSNATEPVPVWLQQKTVNMIDEFTDVNEGEKELMKMWNLHIMRNQYIADCQIAQACSSFVEAHGKEIIDKKLCRNFTIHLVNMFDFSLIKPENVQRCVSQLEMMKEELEMNSS
ncbi:hypothetical protein SNE40_019604 [Patella caerulea]|uniref:Polycomb protein VEFS-Box domain-containing protein n=1 Tax=Patella caerulea TaxID=87958 RepID=A0AAN8J7C4_PATCE